MPQPTGWSVRAASAVATGTTSLTITKPTGTIDDDIMIMVLCHKGADYATVPAGWTLVVQNISGSTRGEMYWKRASSEGANYSITDLADTAAGCIISYIGGLASGNVVDASGSRANASGTEGAASITTTTANVLMVAAVATGNDVTLSRVGTFSGTAPYDHDLEFLHERQEGITTNGTDCAIAAYDGIMIVPGATGAWDHSAASNAENVFMVAAFKPETSGATSGTRYYLTHKVTGSDWEGTVKGTWSLFDSNDGSPRVSRNLLSQQKVGAGELSDLSFFTNQQGNHDVLLGIWVTPKLAAQTLSGTIDLCMAALARWQDDTTPYTTDTSARYKLHVYISDGDSPDVKTVVLDNHVDTVDLPDTTQTWTQLASAQSLTSASIAAGDRLVIEFGIRIVSSPTPTPTYPPTQWSEIDLRGYGATQISNNNHSGVPYPTDGVASGTTLTQVPFIDFSATITESDAATAPDNDSDAEAKAIVSLPYAEDAYDTRGSTDINRSVWYVFEAPTTGKVLFHCFGSNVPTEIEIFTGSPGSLSRKNSGVYSDNDGLRTALWLDAVASTTYHIRVFSQIFQSGGFQKLSAVYRQSPAVDDIILPSKDLVMLRSGVGVVNWTPDLNQFNGTGVAIDYTLRELDDLNGGTHSDYRVYLALHDSPIVEILDLETFNLDELEIDFIDDAFNSEQDAAAQMVLTRDGTLYQGWFGNGYLYVQGAGVLPTVLNDVSDPTSIGHIRGIDASHADNQTDAPFDTADTFAAAAEETAPWAIALHEDGETLYYTSGGFYIAVGGQTIKRYNVSTDTQLDDFATIPASSSPNPGLKGLCLIPSAHGGGLLVCNGSNVARLNDAGSVIQYYTPTPANKGLSLVDVKLLSTGEQFWTLDLQSGSLFRFDLATGAQLEHMQPYLTVGTQTQFALFQPSGIQGTTDTDPETTVKQIRRLRMSPHLSFEQREMFHAEFQVDVEPGVGLATGQGSDPKLMMRFSNTGGKTWSNERTGSVGRIGEYRTQVVWRRLGRARDRVYEVSTSDPVKLVLVDAFLKVEKGTD